MSSTRLHYILAFVSLLGGMFSLSCTRDHDNVEKAVRPAVEKPVGPVDTWVMVSEEPKGGMQYYCNATRVYTTGTGMVQMWVKAIAGPGRIEDARLAKVRGQKAVGGNGEKFRQWQADMILMEFDPNSRRVRIVTSTSYDINSQVIDQILESTPPVWAMVVPETIAEHLMRYAIGISSKPKE